MKVAAVVVLFVAVLLLFIRPRTTINDADARRLVEEGATLLDVRTPAEFAAGHANGALNIPVDQISDRLGEVPRDKPVVLYCRSGMRSGRAASALQRAGYEQVHNLGPMPNW